MAAPIPLEAPVTTATLPVSFFISFPPSPARSLDFAHFDHNRIDEGNSGTIQGFFAFSDAGQAAHIGVQHIAPQVDVGECPVALDVYETGTLQRFTMVRHRGW